MNCELPDVQDGFRKGRGIRDEISNISWIIKKAGEIQKNICFCFIDYNKDFDCVDHNKLWKILQEMGVPDHCSCLLKNMYTGQEAKLELNMEQLTDSKLGKEYAKAVYRHLVYLTYMWSTSCEMPGSMNHKLESRLLGELSTTSDMQMIPRRKGRGTKEPLNEGARGE